MKMICLGSCIASVLSMTAHPVAALQTENVEAVEDRDSENYKDQIIVLARVLNTSGDELRQCLARQCPPEEDITATIEFANNLFLAGDYQKAKNVVGASISRNRKFDTELPARVADLYLARGTIAQHLGEINDFTRSARQVRDILDANLPNGDDRRFFAKIQLGDSRLQVMDIPSALAQYRQAAALAEATGNAELSAFANVRRLSLLFIQAKAGNRPNEIMNIRDQTLEYINFESQEYLIADAARSLASQANLILGNTPVKIAQPANIQTNPLVKPVLLKSVPVNPRATIAGNNANAVLTRFGRVESRSSGFTAVGKWADIGFQINHDGTVSDIEVLRFGGDDHWIKFVIRSIESRLYTPIPADETGNRQNGYAVERYSFTARFSSASRQTGTRVRQRSNIPSLEQTDLDYRLIPADD